MLHDIQNVTFFSFQNEVRGDIKSCKNIQMKFINVKNCKSQQNWCSEILFSSKILFFWFAIPIGRLLPGLIETPSHPIKKNSTICSRYN